jgi:hypothetical protein
MEDPVKPRPHQEHDIGGELRHINCPVPAQAGVAFPVFRRVYKPHKGRPVSYDAWQFSLFSLFFPEIYSERDLVRRRNPGLLRVRSAK